MFGKRTLTALICAMLGLLACSASVDLGGQQPQPQLEPHDLVSTMVAGTLQAMTLEAAASTPTTSATQTRASMLTNAPQAAALSVSSATDCYAGPSDRYGHVITIRPGQVVSVVGQDAADNYWIVEVPGYAGTVCWLSGKFAQLTGDTAVLPAPATPLPSIYTLSEPRNLRISCSSQDLSDNDDDDDDWWHDAQEWSVTFRWTKTEPDQYGVRIFRDGRQVATLGPHASAYSETFIHHGHNRDVTYGVQAYAYNTVSSIVTIDVRHCE